MTMMMMLDRCIDRGHGNETVPVVVAAVRPCVLLLLWLYAAGAVAVIAAIGFHSKLRNCGAPYLPQPRQSVDCAMLHAVVSSLSSQLGSTPIVSKESPPL